jgi:hypothetical protein
MAGGCHGKKDRSRPILGWAGPMEAAEAQTGGRVTRTSTFCSGATLIAA